MYDVYLLDMVFYCIYFWWGQSGVFSRSKKIHQGRILSLSPEHKYIQGNHN